MELGLTRLELVARWNKTLRELNCKFAPMQVPPGVDAKAMESDPRVARIPEADSSKYPTYNAYVDITTAVMDLIAANNERIVSQLRQARIVQ